jgi:hypothetical protein
MIEQKTACFWLRSREEFNKNESKFNEFIKISQLKYYFLLFIISDVRSILIQRHLVETLQDQAQLALAQYVTKHVTSNPARFGKLLLQLPSLRSIPRDTMETRLFRGNPGHLVHALMERLHQA